jgi:gamma-glutamyl hercynylcysteine S-oxide synthase
MAAVAQSTSPRRHFAELLAEARARTILLVSPLSPQDMHTQPDQAVQPVLWELERIVGFEEQWLVGRSTPAEPGSYDEWFDRMMEVRQRALERLEAIDEAGTGPSVEHRFRLVLEHEFRCDEAILETLQLLGEVYRAPRRTSLPRGRRLADPGAMARFPGGTVEIGAVTGSLTWPEEQPAHRVEVEPFWIDMMPVTNGDFITFMAAGGYMTAELWSEAGWSWVRSQEVRMPRHWIWEDGAWWSRWMDHPAPLDLTGPVGIVSYYEAEAFARFVGKRLPTELEWETAATWDPEAQARRNYPWGSMPPSPNVANLDQLAFEPAAVGAFPGNLSPIGCYGLIGDLWEWTASDFLPYPGQDTAAAAPFTSFESGCKVLRGGSWATRPEATRTTVRRPALPPARHLFTGFRCAHDA